MTSLPSLRIAAATVAGTLGVLLAGAALISTGERSGTPGAAAPVSARPVSNAGTTDLSGLYRSVKDGVAYIQADNASGSGFVLDTQGRIVTNEHVVAGSSSLAVRLGDKGALVPARLIGADPATDLAVLQVDPAQTGPLHPLALGDSGAVAVGQPVIAIGSPYGLQSTLTSGIVSALGRDIQSPGGQTISGVIQTDAAINPGNSGGPLLDRQGRVIGINAQIATESGASAGVGFAIPINTVRQAIPGLESGQDAQTAPQTTDPSTDPPAQDLYGQDPSAQDPSAGTDPSGQDPSGGVVILGG